MIERQTYLDKITPFINKQLIKVLIGQRRVGKSYLLQQIHDLLKRREPSANFIFIDKEKFEFDSLRNYADLMNYIEKHKSNGMNYLFIDEIQDIDDFERALRSLYTENNFDIYCTGSNANIFSGELATYLSGRQINIHVGSLNFTEFCEFQKLEPSINSLNSFLKYGGLPYLMHLPDDEKIRFDYLNNINSTILFRDVISRHQIRDARFLTDLLKYLSDNTGSIFSANKIASYMKSQQISKNVPLILQYIQHLEDAFIINRANRIDIQGKKQFEVGEKYYFEDIGLRNAIIGYRPTDINKIIENAVFLHLRNNGFELKIGDLNGKEIDFIASRNGEIIYYQVCYHLSDDKVIKREFGNLLQIEDNFPKYVISMDNQEFKNTYKGINHISLLEFLKKLW